MRLLNTLGSRLRMKSLLNHWVEFRVLAMSYGGKKTLTTLAEKEFLKLKGKLAVDLEWLSSILPADRADDIGTQVEDIMRMIQNHHNLPYEDDENPWDAEAFDKTWHEHFIFLNRLKGMEQSPQGAQAKKLVASLPGAKAPQSAKPKRLVVVKTMPLFSGIVAILSLIVFAKAMGLKKGSKGLVLDPPKSFSEAFGNVMTLGQDFWGQTQNFLEPIVVTYGPMWTAVLLAILLTAFSYLALSNR